MLYEVITLNYATHYLVIVRRSLRPYGYDPELKYFFLVLAGSTVMLTAFLAVQPDHADLPTIFRLVIFQVVSMATSLGLTTTDYATWPVFAQLCRITSYNVCYTKLLRVLQPDDPPAGRSPRPG